MHVHMLGGILTQAVFLLQILLLVFYAVTLNAGRTNRGQNIAEKHVVCLIKCDAAFMKCMKNDGLDCHIDQYWCHIRCKGDFKKDRADRTERMKKEKERNAANGIDEAQGTEEEDEELDSEEMQQRQLIRCPRPT